MPQDSSNDVRQSAYALLGDCAIYVFSQLKPYIKDLMTPLTDQLQVENIDENDDDNSFSVINNACWSCGEIALQEGLSPSISAVQDIR